MKSVPGLCISGEFPTNSFCPIQVPDNSLDKGHWKMVSVVVLGTCNFMVIPAKMLRVDGFLFLDVAHFLKDATIKIQVSSAFQKFSLYQLTFTKDLY